MKTIAPCPCCGQRIVEYKHTLTAALVAVLRRLWDCGGGPVHFSTLGLTYNQASNMQKLRYWGLIAKADHRKPKGGEWVLTTYGEWYLTGKHKVAKHAWTRNGSVVRREDPFVSIHDVEREGKYWVKPGEWGERQRRLGKDLQLKLAM